MKYIIGILCLIIFLISILFFKGLSSINHSSKDKYTNIVNNEKTENNNIEHFKTEKDLLMKLSIVSDDDHVSDNEMDIKIRLYDDIVPLTCKNFRHIALKGINNRTYNGNIFHRIIPGFMIQGGDIVNHDGTGSISIYGDRFEDENFIKKHNKPGLLSMANSGPNTNGSQFFITTYPANHLDNKHVVFGEVIEGYENVTKIENLPTDSSDRPYQEVQILSIKEI